MGKLTRRQGAIVHCRDKAHTVPVRAVGGRAKHLSGFWGMIVVGVALELKQKPEKKTVFLDHNSQLHFNHDPRPISHLVGDGIHFSTTIDRSHWTFSQFWKTL